MTLLTKSAILAANAADMLRAEKSGLTPAAMDRLKLTPEQMFARAIDLFFGGLLTSTGRKDYEKHVAN